MPRRAKGARLYFRKDLGTWIIRDTGRSDRSTGTSVCAIAEKALAAYIANKDVAFGFRRPDEMSISEVLSIYAEQHGTTVAAPERIAYAMQALLGFWGLLKVGDLKGETCRRYAKSRVRKLKDGSDRPISNGTIRRELNVLQAAINYCHREGYLLQAQKVTLPEKPPSKDTWLTRSEAASLVWSAYRSRSGKHLARFILLSLYTGTRRDAVLNLSFGSNISGGQIDVENGVIYRRGKLERETKKRRKPVKMTRGIWSHCRRWKKMGMNWLVQIDGQRVGNITHAFEGACRRAGLIDVSPHVLKHTAITWAIQKGLSVEDAADYFDTSAETIRKVYYHHSPAYQDRAVSILERKL